ncbi:MAG TPA: putative porin, partial [Ferruginibacter sp.]|nr:putative porin [Ferruginibacter sp.]
MKQVITLFILVFCFGNSYAQDDVIKGVSSRLGNLRNVNTGRKDTIGFEHRNDKKDSISITYKYLDSIRSIPFDSSINDFDTYFSVPSSYLYLGNNGAAAYSLIFMPNARPGWDAGFHAFDVYRYTLEGTKFYRTNKPFSQLSYQIASGKEQMIKIFHTQNPRPNWAFGFDYRLISAPGFFTNQNANHKNYRLFSNYQGKRKRYAAFLVLVGNTIKNSENGGIRYDSALYDPNQSERFSVDVNLGNDYAYKANPFVTTVNTGNVYKDFTLFVRQTYDIGKKDSVAINDSSTEYLFYPRLRAQHSFTYSTYNYLFRDNLADTNVYKAWYDTVPKIGSDSFFFRDKWTVMGNDFTLLSFPDTKNSGQFLS